MKFVLSILICCLLVIMGTVVFAPEYAHEIIDKIHNNRNTSSEPHVHGTNTRTNNDNPDDKSTTTPQGKKYYTYTRKAQNDTFDDSATTPQSIEPIIPGGGGKIVPQDETPTKTYWSVKQPCTESEILDWLKKNNYEMKKGYGIYHVSVQVQKRASLSKPTAIVVHRDGTVVPRYEQTVIVNEGGVAVVGQNVVLKGGGSSQSVWGKASINNNGISTTVSLTDLHQGENGYWWIVITRSFDWILGTDSIKNVLSNAKKIKEVNDEN